MGLMLVAADNDALTHDVRGTLEILAGQVAIAIEDCRLWKRMCSLRALAHGSVWPRSDKWPRRSPTK